MNNSHSSISERNENLLVTCILFIDLYILLAVIIIYLESE